MDLRAFYSSIPSNLSSEARNFLFYNLPSYSSSCYRTSDPLPVEWIIDSGASHHVTPDSSFLSSCSKATPIPHLQTADGSLAVVEQIGCFQTPSFSITDVLHIPNFCVNILSVSQLTEQGYEIVFSSSGCHIKEPGSEKIIGSGRRVGGVYVLTNLNTNSKPPASNHLQKDEKVGGEEKKAITVVYKLNLHCDGCAKNIKHIVHHFEGVDDVSVDTASNKLVATGKVDPAALGAWLEHRSKRKVELVSSQPKHGGGSSDKQNRKKLLDEKLDDDGDDNGDNNNNKQLTVTVIYGLDLHCKDCANNLEHAIHHFEGVEDVKADSKCNVLEVTGNVNPAALRAKLEQKYKRKVELISVGPKMDGGSSSDTKKSFEKSNHQKLDDKPEDDKKNSEGEKDDDDDDGDSRSTSVKKDDGPSIVTYRLAIIHCIGCANKLKRAIRHFNGVEEVKVDIEKNKLEVTGKLDAVALRERIEDKMKMKVEIVSLLPIKKTKPVI